MQIFIITIILISGISNSIADLFLVSGQTKVKSTEKGVYEMERIRKTPLSHISISGILGLISLVFWFSPLYYLAKIPTFLGFASTFTFAAMVGTIAVFHVVCAFACICFKYNEDSFKAVEGMMKAYGGLCFLWAGAYTVSMIVLSAKNVLELNFVHYLTLPLFSILIIQFGLGNALKKIPYFSSISGTLSMVVSLLGTIYVIWSNGMF